MLLLVYSHFAQYRRNRIDIESHQNPFLSLTLPQDDSVIAIHQPPATKIVEAFDLRQR